MFFSSFLTKLGNSLLAKCHCKWLFLFFFTTANFISVEAKDFVNPITDVCWDCVFPMTISGANVTPGHQDQTSYSQKVCICAGTPPKIGIPITFWEPTMLVDVTRHAYKMIGLGGVSIGKESIKNRGSVSIDADVTQSSFYHVHLYRYPVFALLDLLTDFSESETEIAYMSELDPLWNDDALALIVNPDAGFFSSNLAHIACLADCTASSSGKPLDKLFWCAGCEGSLYPFTGTVAHHIGGIQASSLLVHRVLAKLHRSLFLKGYKNNASYQAEYLPIIKKSLYKTQLVRPTPQTKGPCHPLGKSDTLWGSGKQYPRKGEDFVYFIWQKKQYCLDAAKPIVSGGNL